VIDLSAPGPTAPAVRPPRAALGLAALAAVFAGALGYTVLSGSAVASGPAVPAPAVSPAIPAEVTPDRAPVHDPAAVTPAARKPLPSG